MDASWRLVAGHLILPVVCASQAHTRFLPTSYICREEEEALRLAHMLWSEGFVEAIPGAAAKGAAAGKAGKSKGHAHVEGQEAGAKAKGAEAKGKGKGRQEKGTSAAAAGAKRGKPEAEEGGEGKAKKAKAGGKK